MAPMSGIRFMNIHPPPLPMSCNLLTETASDGNSSASDINPDSTKNSVETTLMLVSIPITKLITIMANTNNQNSFLLALPLNSAYFLVTTNLKLSIKSFIMLIV